MCSKLPYVNYAYLCTNVLAWWKYWICCVQVLCVANSSCLREESKYINKKSPLFSRITGKSKLNVERIFYRTNYIIFVKNTYYTYLRKCIGLICIFVLRLLSVFVSRHAKDEISKLALLANTNKFNESLNDTFSFKNVRRETFS